ncbi:nuclear transport factor 2 family protein [Streptomyces sp. NPDC050560]|uniref:nuclear transport factor 2 family protein n=1 Tax=Streptomyces sp. NPDC050560 TaxID=3365630 RepID=UPI0037B78B84
MTVQIPMQAVRYLVASDGEPEDVLPALAPGATIIDEGRSHTGEGAILEWRRRSRSGGEFRYTRSFLGLLPSASGTFTATYRIEGNFPGSPVDLRYVFTLDDDGLVTRLEITP